MFWDQSTTKDYFRAVHRWWTAWDLKNMSAYGTQCLCLSIISKLRGTFEIGQHRQQGASLSLSPPLVNCRRHVECQHVDYCNCLCLSAVGKLQGICEICQHIEHWECLCLPTVGNFWLCKNIEDCECLCLFTIGKLETMSTMWSAVSVCLSITGELHGTREIVTYRTPCPCLSAIGGRYKMLT